MSTNKRITNQLTGEYTTDKLISEHTTAQLAKAALKSFFTKTKILITSAVVAVAAVLGILGIQSVLHDYNIWDHPFYIVLKAVVAAILIAAVAMFFSRVGKTSQKKYVCAAVTAAIAVAAAAIAYDIYQCYATADLTAPLPPFIKLLGLSAIDQIPFYIFGLVAALQLGRSVFFKKAK